MTVRSVDLSDFTISISYMDDKVRYFDETDNQDKEARECEITWTHNSLSVTPLKYYLRENHENWESNIANRQMEILTDWFRELGYEPVYYNLDRDSKTWNIKGVVETQAQKDKWLKPNPSNIVPPTTPEIL